jgi:PIN domain nuclease of toxin-antitoxin system
MRLMLDTHALAWFGAGSRQLSARARVAMAADESDLFVSAVTAYEYGDLHARGRFPDSVGLKTLCDDLAIEILDFPALLWKAAVELPRIHRDPIDRMMIAHAKAERLTLVSSDEAVQKYPVDLLW